MASQETIFDSPTAWVKKHIQDYVESDGVNGQQWQRLPTLLLTTRGRTSGLLRRTALIYGQDGANYLLVASNRGASTHPLWYLNLVTTPSVALQVGAKTFTAVARTATPEEKAHLWPLMTTIFPQYIKYQAKAKRDIPLVIVEPDEHA